MNILKFHQNGKPIIINLIHIELIRPDEEGRLSIQFGSGNIQIFDERFEEFIRQFQQSGSQIIR